MTTIRVWFLKPEKAKIKKPVEPLWRLILFKANWMKSFPLSYLPTISLPLIHLLSLSPSLISTHRDRQSRPSMSAACRLLPKDRFVIFDVKHLMAHWLCRDVTLKRQLKGTFEWHLHARVNDQDISIVSLLKIEMGDVSGFEWP